MKNRDFRANGNKYCVVESNNTNWKWQAILFEKAYNAWVRTNHYANTQVELKEKVKEYWKEV